MSGPHGMSAARRYRSLEATKWACMPICIAISASCLPNSSCAETQQRPRGAIPATPLGGTGVAGATATQARRQNWNCQWIEQAIASLVAEMQAAKTLAEKEEEQLATTLARLLARISGPPGAGNGALVKFEEARREADQLNDLLGEKGCARYVIGVEAPAFMRQ